MPGSLSVQMQISFSLEGGATSFLLLPTSLLAEMCRACWYEITNCLWFLKILLQVPSTKLPPSSEQQPAHLAPFGTADSAAPCLWVTGTAILTSNKKELCQRLLRTDGQTLVFLQISTYQIEGVIASNHPALRGLCNHGLEDSSQLILWNLSPKLANIARKGSIPLSALDVTPAKWGWETLDLVYE